MILTASRRCAFIAFTFFLPFFAFAQTNPESDSNTKQIAANANNSPASVLIILDISASMKSTSKLNKVLLESLSDFVGQSHKNNEYFVVGISTVPKLLLDSSTDVEATQTTISNIKKQKPEGASAFYDAFFRGVKKLSQAQYSPKIVLILSDGIDTISEKTLDELLASLKDEKVVSYAVNINSQENKISLQGKKVLDKITSTTSGEVYNVKKIEEIKSSFDSIREKLRN